MPIQHTDADGREVKGGTTHITGGCCIGLFALIALALVGAGYLIGGTLDLLL